MKQIFLYRFLCGHNVFTILFYLGVGLLGQGVCLILCETAKLFQSSCTSLHSHQQFLYLGSFSLFNLDHSNGCVVVSPCVFLSYVFCGLFRHFTVVLLCTFFVSHKIFFVWLAFLFLSCLFLGKVLNFDQV